MKERLECGHDVDIKVGVVLYNYYDCGFGTVVKVDDLPAAPGQAWHNLRSLGAKHWPEGRVTLLNAQRMVCEPCGHAFIDRNAKLRRG